MSRRPRLLIVGQQGGTSVGASLLAGAAALGADAFLADVEGARSGSRWLDRAAWHLLGHRPARLARFGDGIVSRCRELRPDLLLATGMAPLTRRALARLGALGVGRCVFLTDDPWNRGMRGAWFQAALPAYDVVYTPRRANLSDLTAAGCRQARYLPFAYDPQLFFPEPPGLGGPLGDDGSVVFVGGADRDRLPFAAALIEAQLPLRLYGGYWDRHAATAAYAQGVAGPELIRRATAAAAVNICLVRRANRDGHVMRTYEIAAAGGCMLAERTLEHTAILGPPGAAVQYFDGPAELVAGVRWLLARPAERARLRSALHARVAPGNTYRDRLAVILADHAAGPPAWGGV